MQLSILTDENQQKNAQNLRHKSCKKQNKKGNSLLLTCSRHRTLQNILISILQIFVFVYCRGDKKTFLLFENIVWTNENVFLSPFNKQKQRYGELEFEYFGGSDVVNKLQTSSNFSLFFKYVGILKNQDFFNGSSILENVTKMA